MSSSGWWAGAIHDIDMSRKVSLEVHNMDHRLAGLFRARLAGGGIAYSLLVTLRVWFFAVTRLVACIG